jgi:hypothetical protein
MADDQESLPHADPEKHEAIFIARVRLVEELDGVFVGQATAAATC